MAEGFGSRDESEKHVYIHLCIFPHLPDFLVLDLRGETAKLWTLNAREIFDTAFFENTEKAFSQSLREETPHPFLHMMSMPIRIDELMREMGLSAVLNRLEITLEGVKEPRVAVMIMHGPVLSLSSSQLRETFSSLFHDGIDDKVVEETLDRIQELIAKESAIIKQLEQKDLLEALEDKSPNFFTLWENQG